MPSCVSTPAFRSTAVFWRLARTLCTPANVTVSAPVKSCSSDTPMNGRNCAFPYAYWPARRVPSRPVSASGVLYDTEDTRSAPLAMPSC
ncbi:Uncharacterised protein [Bordetella pertussis]|nr:Uncharacterised protein [Bordetella pertussis]